MTADGEQPVGYRMILLPPPPARLNGLKEKPYEVDYATIEEATAVKRRMQEKGWVCSVVPVFLSKQVRGKMRKKRQARCAPPGFTKDWRFADPPGGGE